MFPGGDRVIIWNLGHVDPREGHSNRGDRHSAPGDGAARAAGYAGIIESRLNFCPSLRSQIDAIWNAFWSGGISNRSS